MPYKVFFVEDEIVTREGIRDNVNWRANGFEFCGEAADGEMALPLIQALKPDVLITDIKMPFMDGLQLSKIIRERMPWVKIIVLSGHDEFEYAQQAIALGVNEYLLKPVTVQTLHQALQKIAAQLDREQEEQQNLKKLQEQVEENRSTLREKLLLKLILGAISPSEAIEKGHSLGMDLVARCYLVILLRTELGDRSEQFDYDEYQRVQQIVARLIENNPDIFFFKKDWDELVLIMKGSTPEYLEEEKELLLRQIQLGVKQTRYQTSIGSGSPKKRIADIYQSFVEALVSLQIPAEGPKDTSPSGFNQAELLKVDKAAVEDYLRCGTEAGFDKFFEAYLQTLGETALKSTLLKNYLIVDVALATAKLVHELGGDIEQIVPALKSIETSLDNIKTIGQLREQTHAIISGALAFRDGHASGQYQTLIRQARDYIEKHFQNPELSLNDVAAQVNLSASHFSVVFGQETRQNFKEYLTEIRVKKAMELLRTTSLKAAEIAYQVGYNDPHYFSAAFKKKAGFSPIEFRSQAKAK